MNEQILCATCEPSCAGCEMSFTNKNWLTMPEALSYTILTESSEQGTRLQFVDVET